MSYNELKQRGTVDFPIELHYIDKNHTRYEMTSHWHSELEIIRILDGELSVKINNRSYTAKKGDIIFINSEALHGAIPNSCIYECIVFHVDFLYAGDYSCRFFVENLLNHEYIINEFNPNSSSAFNEAANNIFNAMNNKSSGYKFSVIGALYNLFGVIIDNHLYSTASGSLISNDKNVPKLKNVLSYMRNNYDKQISLNDMAIAAGMSPKYFCYFFRDMTGKTPVEYLNGYRIEKASKKLLNTDLSITDIAYLCGFNDLSYFIKTFKSIKNITPTKFRKI